MSDWGWGEAGGLKNFCSSLYEGRGARGLDDSFMSWEEDWTRLFGSAVGERSELMGMRLAWASTVGDIPVGFRCRVWRPGGK